MAGWRWGGQCHRGWVRFDCADDGVLDGQVAEDGLTSSDLARFIKDVRFPRSMLHTPLLRPLLNRAKFDNSFGAWEPDTFDPDPDQEDPDAEQGYASICT